MKKYVLIGIFSIFFGLSAFSIADYVSPVVLTSSGGKVYTNYGYNYYNAYIHSSHWYCGKTQIFGIGNYSDYYNGIFNFSGLVDSNLVYGDTGIFIKGFNNGYYLTGGLIYSPFFVGSIYDDGLSCNSAALPTFSDTSYFSIGFMSGNILHTISYNPQIGGCYNGCHYVGGGYSIPLYNTDVLLANSSYIRGLFNHFIYIDYNNNLYFYFDDNKIYSKWGSNSDVPYSSDGAIRKKFLINDDFNYSTIYVYSGEIDFYSVNDGGIIGAGGDFPSLTVNPNYGYFLFHIFDYSSGFLSSSESTFLLSMTSSGIIYNAYNVNSNNVEELLSLEPVRRGYFVGDFNTFVNSDGQYFEVYGSYINGVTFRVYPQNSNIKYTNYSFTFVEDNSVSLIDPNGWSLQLTSGSVHNSIKDKCISNNTFFQLNTLLCNSMGVGVGATITKNDQCFQRTVVYNTDGGITYKWFPCGYVSDHIVVDNSGSVLISCSGSDCISNIVSEYYYNSGSSIVSGSYYESDNFFFSCPYPVYTGKFISKISNVVNLGDFDLSLPIQCYYSAFMNGKTKVLFSGLVFDDVQLLGSISGSNDDRRYLFPFLDFILSLGLLIFLLKLYHLFK